FRLDDKPYIARDHPQHIRTVAQSFFGSTSLEAQHSSQFGKSFLELVCTGGWHEKRRIVIKFGDVAPLVSERAYALDNCICLRAGEDRLNPGDSRLRSEQVSVIGKGSLLQFVGKVFLTPVESNLGSKLEKPSPFKLVSRRCINT